MRYIITDMEGCVSLTWDFQRRARFQPNLFHHETPEEAAKPQDDPGFAGLVGVMATSPEPVPPVEEVWFAGCHSDVGGGEVKDVVRYSVGDISLRWMIKQVILSECGIEFDAAALRRVDIDVSTIALAGPAQQGVEQLRRKSESETEIGSSPSGDDGSSDEDMIRKGKDKVLEEQTWSQGDMLAGIYDQLKSQPLWWILEFMPMKFTWQDADGTWKSKLGYAVAALSEPNRLSLTYVETLALESTSAEVERSGANSPISTKACDREWPLQISNTGPMQDGSRRRNDTLNETCFGAVIWYSSWMVI